jgi:uncharacterized membrane protein YfcA
VSFWMDVAVAAALLTSLALSVIRALSSKDWKTLFVELLAILAIAVFLRYLFGFPIPSATYAKSPSSDWAIAIALFVCMLLGMFAQYLYGHFASPKAMRKEFDWGIFVAPVFASPIVFVPLLAALQNADIDLTHLTASRMMVFLVAFQNGFFWKEHFDRQRREAKTK